MRLACACAAALVATTTVLLAATPTANAMPARDPVGAPVAPLPLTQPHSARAESITGRAGYRLAGADGSMYTFGASYAGSLARQPHTAPIIATASTPHFGYWLAAADGGVAAFGDAHLHGSMGGKHLNKPIIAMASTPTGGGYWLVASDGGIFSFGDAHFYGSTGAIHLWQPIVGMAPTPTGHGYWLVASDGGIFSFGDAHFYGSMGGKPLNRPVVGMASTPAGHGYWLVASDGGIFSFGDAHFHGSTGAIHLWQPITAMAATPDGGGYWLAASDGGVFTFGDAPYNGSAAGGFLPGRIVGISVQHSLDPYQPGSTGYDISWPQCGGTLPPAPHDVTIVGINDGHMFSTNPCLGTESTWAGDSLTVYVNTNGLPSDNTSGVHGARNCFVSDLRCRSYNWGRSAATYDLDAAHNAGVHASMWWLDVETTNHWPTADLAANAQIIQGLLDGLRADGLIVGIYATSYQFGVITGSGYTPGVPLWVPGAQSSSAAPGFCASSHTFGGGITWMTQWTRTYDQDYACPQS